MNNTKKYIISIQYKMFKEYNYNCVQLILGYVKNLTQKCL